jgi:uncharacterized protein YkwD
MRQLTRLLATAVLSLGLVVGASALATPAQAKTWLAPAADPEANPQKNLNEFENRILIQINKARVDAGLKKVKLFESCVDGKSETWARKIKKSGDFVHRDQTAVLKDCDLAWTGETLVRGIGLTPEVAVSAWMNSPSHKAVIMKPRARWAGIGVKVDGQGRTVGVLNFGDAS